MKKYRVIWFDDEYEELHLLKQQATINGIYHVGYTNAEEGIKELEKNYRDYDAVIIDGLFFRKKGQSGDAKNNGALVDVFRLLDQIREKKIIPSFILSGDPSYTKTINPFAEQYKENKVYNKQYKDDLESLWEDIKEEANKQDDTQIRHQFHDFFIACVFLQIEPVFQHYLIDVLKCVKFSNVIDEMLYYAQLRKIIELVFRRAEKHGLLHSRCIQRGEVNLSESSLFLAGEQTKHLGVRCLKKHFPKIIAEKVKDIIFTTGAAVHTEQEDIKNSRLSLEELRKTNNTSYLLYSLTFQLMDVIIWYKQYEESNPDIERNKSLWIQLDKTAGEGEWIKGEVIRIAENGYGTFQPSNGGKTLTIIPNWIKEFKLCSHQTIEVITKLESKSSKTIIEHIRVV